MSFQQKKKIVDKLILDEGIDAELEAYQQIVVYLGPAGVNIHRVIPLEFCPDLQIDSSLSSSSSATTNSTHQFLVSMAKKYRGVQYLKKYDLVIIDNIIEGKKVLGEINTIITKSHVASLYKRKEWPSPSFFDSLESEKALSDWNTKFNLNFLSTKPSSTNTNKKDNNNGCEVQDFIVSSSSEDDECSSSEDEDEGDLEEAYQDQEDEDEDDTLSSGLNQEDQIQKHRAAAAAAIL